MKFMPKHCFLYITKFNVHKMYHVYGRTYTQIQKNDIHTDRLIDINRTYYSNRTYTHTHTHRKTLDLHMYKQK